MNITLFIDADNISYYNYKKIIDFINNENTNACMTIKIFGNFSTKLLNRWKRFVSASYNKNVTFINVPIIKKKNITDHVIIIEAMKGLYKTEIDIFALASDDVDFIPLYEIFRQESKIIWQISQNIDQTKIFDEFVDIRIDLSVQDNLDFNYLSNDELISFIDKAIEIKSINGYALLGDVKYWIDSNIDVFSMEKTRYRKFSNLVIALGKYELINEDSEFKIKIKA